MSEWKRTSERVTARPFAHAKTVEGARRAGLTPILLGAAPGAGCHTITRLRDLLTLLEADFTGKP